MKTDDLIAALAADGAERRPPVSRGLSIALAAGGLVSLVVFMAALGPRLDLAWAFSTWRFDLKLAIVAVALVLALIDCIQIARPEVRSFASRATWLVPILLLAAVAVEIALVPAAEWGRKLVGTNSLFCLVTIPALSLAPLVAGLIAMRSGAPSSPAAAGAAVGRLAAAIAASLYAFHCFDDSPLFVATWYTLATVIVMAAGAAIGSRALKW